MSVARRSFGVLMGSLSVTAALLAGGCSSLRAPVQPPEPQTEVAQDDAFDEMTVLTEAMLLVRRHYVDELTYKRIVYTAIDGLLSGLDPNSSFLPPEPLAHLEEETRGSFDGIGVSVGADAQGVKVIAPIEDSPAFRAGIHAGDTIMAVDGKKLSGGSVEEAVKAMRGEKGSPVNVTVERATGETVEVSLVRDEIKVSSVKGVKNLGDGIGYVRITQFNEPVADDFARALQTLGKDRLTGLVVDLRDNPGGLLESAVAVAEQVLPKGREIVTVRGRDSERPQQRFDAGACEHRETDLPIALLVNGGSASASEVVAGALQAHKRAVVVGERTYGKASVQNVIRMALRPDCALRLTTGYYYTPDGQMIHGKGISPDVEVVVPKAEWRQAQMRRMLEEMPGAASGGVTNLVKGVTDVQLERAKEILKGARILGGNG